MKTYLNATIDVELMEKLKELAKKENRNFSNLIETLLYKAVNDKL